MILVDPQKKTFQIIRFQCFCETSQLMQFTKYICNTMNIFD